MEDTLRTLLFDTVVPNRLQEVAELKRYISDGSPYGEPLFLSLGETWEHTPEALRKSMGKAPLYAHGYQLSMYGLPEFRQLVGKYIEDSHKLAKVATLGVDYEIAASWTGTRNAMYDFGRLLLHEYFDGAGEVITTAPGWDYPGVFGSLSYKISYVQLEKEKAFHPEITSFEQAVANPAARKALLVINAQHNPTSVNWPETLVRQLIKLALENSLALLIDDAHYGVCHPDVKPTSSLRILLEELQNYPNYTAPWMAVRSFGKQFGINGWGIGALTAAPKLLDRFVNVYRTQHIYNYGGVMQYALGEWLKSTEPSNFLSARSQEIMDNKQMIQSALIEKFGYPERDIFIGDCTNFILFSIPEHFAEKNDGVKAFLRQCLSYGIVLTDAWPKPYDTPTDVEDNFNCIRLFAGASTKTIQLFLERLEAHGFGYGMQAFQ
ncbi:MAG TPA: pyridoxal phosphate-dependent aminotransferase [Candidatus Saccharimonadales bacterium]|nr:pyridoxal phosphate-dependent aminotransferase [Candidatus Saccharimonadales bacterium]